MKFQSQVVKLTSKKHMFVDEPFQYGVLLMVLPIAVVAVCLWPYNDDTV